MGRNQQAVHLDAPPGSGALRQRTILGYHQQQLIQVFRIRGYLLEQMGMRLCSLVSDRV